MKNDKLGIIGLGSRSTLWYIQQLNLRYNEINGGYSTCPFVLINADFNEINQNLPNNFISLEPLIKKYLDELKSMDCSNILIPNITIHETIDRIESIYNLDYGIIHPLKLIPSKVSTLSSKKSVVLGTKYSMNSSYIKGYIEESGGSVINMTTQQETIIDKLRTSIYENGITSNYIKIFDAILAELTGFNVFISCTELSLIPTKSAVVDLASLQVEYALQKNNFI